MDMTNFDAFFEYKLNFFITFLEKWNNYKIYQILQNHCDGAWHDGEDGYYFGINNELKLVEVKTPENMAAKIIDIINAI